jgi:hypothetical protein
MRIGKRWPQALAAGAGKSAANDRNKPADSGVFWGTEEFGVIAAGQLARGTGDRYPYHS